jgi:hypothetical protein
MYYVNFSGLSKTTLLKWGWDGRNLPGTVVRVYPFPMIELSCSFGLRGKANWKAVVWTLIRINEPFQMSSEKFSVR